MINISTEELRNFMHCLSEEQSYCDALARMDFSRGTANLTAPKPLQDKALKMGGGG